MDRIENRTFRWPGTWFGCVLLGRLQANGTVLEPLKVIGDERSSDGWTVRLHDARVGLYGFRYH